MRWRLASKSGNPTANCQLIGHALFAKRSLIHLDVPSLDLDLR